MLDNNKRSRAIVALLVLVALSILGFAIWQVKNQKEHTNNSYTSACSSAAQASTNKSFQLPGGWSWYGIRDIGVRYAYPDDWGSPTTQTNSGVVKYVTSFTVSSSEANTTVTLRPNCSDFETALSDIKKGRFDTSSNLSTTKAIEHSRISYSSLSHWSSDEGNQYKLTTFYLVNVGYIKSAEVDYSIVSGTEVCPDDKFATSDQLQCIDKTIGDEVKTVISSLQKI